MLLFSVVAATGVAAPVELLVAPDGGTPFSTLSGAVAAAPPGSIIRVRPGAYRETVIIDKNLSLVGIDPDQGVRIDGEGRRPALRITTAVTCRLENLVLHDGIDLAGGGAQLSDGAVVDFINCTFHDNTARADGGAVVVRDTGTWVEFIGCHFQRNRSLDTAGAVSVSGGAELTLRACTFFANTADGIGGGVTVRTGAPMVVEDCLFIENQGLECGAIHVVDAPVRIAGSTFFRNASLDGATVFVKDAATADVTNNIFASDLDGAGLRIPDAGLRGCNLYSDNLAGPLLGARPNADEMMTDPGFCDFRSLDLSLCRTSPASGQVSDCGRIGALDVGCLEGLEARQTPAPNRRVH